MAKVEKIGTIEILEVHRSGRRIYVNLDPYMVRTYELEPGDMLKVSLVEVHRAERPEEE